MKSDPSTHVGLSSIRNRAQGRATWDCFSLCNFVSAVCLRNTVLNILISKADKKTTPYVLSRAIIRFNRGINEIG